MNNGQIGENKKKRQWFYFQDSRMGAKTLLICLMIPTGRQSDEFDLIVLK